MSKNTEYQIVYAADDNFAEILGISLISLFENNRDASDIRLTILDEHISERNRNKIENICIRYQRPLPQWLTAINVEERLNLSIQIDRGSFSQYSRIFVASVLPKSVERVLYLDCDIIIKKPLFELWNLDLHGNTVAALMDAFSKHYRMNVELEPEDIMFNSGVMLIDMKKWRERQIENKLLEFISRHRGKIQQSDQGVLNAVLSKETYCFEPRFNSVTIFYDFSYREMMLYRKPPCFYSEEAVKKAIEDPVIIHFTTSFLSNRPWMKNCHHKYKGEWDKYKALSPWSTSEERRDPRPVWKKISVVIYRVLPRELSVRMAGIFQIYGRPWKNRVLDWLKYENLLVRKDKKWK